MVMQVVLHVQRTFKQTPWHMVIRSTTHSKVTRPITPTRSRTMHHAVYSLMQ